MRRAAGRDAPEPTPRADTSSYGCLPASLFGLFLGPAVVLGSAFADCPTSGGCGHGFSLPRNLVILASLCALIFWATNRMVAARHRQGLPGTAGVAGVAGWRW